MRLAAAGVLPADLDAVFLTHHHSDHVTGLADLAISRWVVPHKRRESPLRVVAPKGASSQFAEHVLDPFEADLKIRRHHTGRAAQAAIEVSSFIATDDPDLVWESGDISVFAVSVDHGPVKPAVGYRVETPDGVVAISGDCTVCPTMENLAKGADVLVHEAIRTSAVLSTGYAPIANYHADTKELGAMAERNGVPHLLLTHLIPQPVTEEDVEAFGEDIRDAGYTGNLVVGRDLSTLTVTRSVVVSGP